MFALAQHVRGYGDVMRVVLNGGNGHTRRNAAHDGDDGTARDAIGGGWALRLYPTETSLNDIRTETLFG